MSVADSSDYLDEARRRARSKKSAWNLLLVPFCVIAIGGAWTAIAFLFEAYRHQLFPSGAFLSSGTRIGNILMFVTPAFPSLAIGLIIGNFLVWLIPAARAAQERRMPPGGHSSFRSTQLALTRFGAVLAVAALPFGLLGANNLWAITPDRIDYRPMLSAATRHYEWSTVAKIETGCYSGKSVTYNFVVTLADRTRIDLMEESPREFVAAYPRIKAALRASTYRFSSRNFVGSCVGYAPRPWREILTKPPNQ